MKQNAQLYLMLCLVATLIACTPITAPSGSTPSGPTVGATTPSDAPAAEIPGENLALVDTIEIRILKSDPVQVEVVARGNLPDGCTQLVDAEITLDGPAFHVTLPTQRPADAICTQALVPFEQVIPLDVADAAPGEYTVDVNGVTEAFELRNE